MIRHNQYSIKPGPCCVSRYCGLHRAAYEQLKISPNITCDFVFQNGDIITEDNIHLLQPGDLLTLVKNYTIDIPHPELLTVKNSCENPADCWSAGIHDAPLTGITLEIYTDDNSNPHICTLETVPNSYCAFVIYIQRLLHKQNLATPNTYLLFIYKGHSIWCGNLREVMKSGDTIVVKIVREQNLHKRDPEPNPHYGIGLAYYFF